MVQEPQREPEVTHRRHHPRIAHGLCDRAADPAAQAVLDDDHGAYAAARRTISAGTGFDPPRVDDGDPDALLGAPVGHVEAASAIDPTATSRTSWHVPGA